MARKKGICCTWSMGLDRWAIFGAFLLIFGTLSRGEKSGRGEVIEWG